MSGVVSLLTEKQDLCFTNGELLVLTVALASSAESSILPLGRLSQRLLCSLRNSNFPLLASDLFGACIALGVKGHTDLLFNLLEAGGDVIESLTKEISQKPIQSPVPRVPLYDPLSSLVVLLAIALPSHQFSAAVLMELLGNDISFCICVTAHAFSKACGTRPGIAAVLQGNLQKKVSSSLIKVLRSFSSWKVYETMIHHKLVKFSRGNCIPDKFCGQYRGYVSSVSGQLMKLCILKEIAVFFMESSDNICEYHQVAKETALFLESLVTLTDQLTVQFRKFVLNSHIIERFLIPFLQHQDASGRLSCGNSSKIDVVRALATLSYGNKGIQAMLKDHRPQFETDYEAMLGRIPECSRGSLILQLTRLAINARLSALLSKVAEFWKAYDTKSQHHMLSKLTPSTCFSPVEANSEFARFCNLVGYNGDEVSNRLSSVRCSRRRKRKNRYRNLKQLSLQEEEEVLNSVPDEPLTHVEVESSSSYDSNDVQVDLSEWRKGPPPSGIPLQYICSLTNRFIQSAPVLSPQGLLFDRTSILSYLETSNKCPITGEILRKEDLLVDEEIFQELQTIRNNFVTAN